MSGESHSAAPQHLGLPQARGVLCFGVLTDGPGHGPSLFFFFAVENRPVDSTGSHYYSVLY